MGKRKAKREYRCPYPPCIYVVYDERRKIYRVFVEEEFGEGEVVVTSIPVWKLREACEELRYVMDKGFREARDDEIDFLARKYLKIYKIIDEENY